MFPPRSEALITGASSGLGAEFARQLHQRGLRVHLVARRYDRLQALATELNAARPDSAVVVAADLTIPADLERIRQYLQSEAIAVFINNAGHGSFGYFEQLPLAHEQHLVNLNVLATTTLAHAAALAMKPRRYGWIVTVSSIAGFQPLPYLATYAASKAFNLFHALALHHELAPFGVRVLTLCPGPTDTEFAGVARIEGTFSGVRRDSATAVVRRALYDLERQRAISVPGFRWRLASIASRLVPLTLSTWISRLMLTATLQAELRQRGDS